MGEQTGSDKKEIICQEINDKLAHIESLNLEEVKKLHNLLVNSKDDYLNYMTKFYAKKYKGIYFMFGSGIALFIILCFALLNETIAAIPTIVITSLLGYLKCRITNMEMGLDNYKSSLTKINDLIHEKEKNIDKTLVHEQAVTLEGSKEELTETRYGYTLSSVFPTPEIEEMAMKVVRDKNEQDLKEEQLTLKRDLTKDSN